MRKTLARLAALLITCPAYAAVDGDGTNYLAGSGQSYSWAVSSGDITIAGWIWFEVAATNGFEYPFALLASGPDDAMSFSWDNNSAPSRFAWIGQDTGGYTAYQYSPEPSTGAWHHIGITIDGDASTNNVEIYIDGANDTPVANDLGDRVAATDTIDLFGDGFGGSVFQGRMAEWAIWNVELSASDFSDMFAGKPPGTVSPANIQFHWQGLAEASVETQLAANGGSLTETGAGNLATAASHPPINYSTSTVTRRRGM